jgi:uncharacterized protein DUF6245
MESTQPDDVAIGRLEAALSALGEGDACREVGADELGGSAAYRAWLASVLLGTAQAEAVAADSAPLSRDARYAIRQRQLNAAGVRGDIAAQVELIRWQVQRSCSPLPALAAEQAIDPIPLAAGQAAEGLQVLLSVMVATQGAVAAGDVPRLADQAGKLRETCKVLRAAVDNTERLLELLGSVDI